MAKKSMRRRNHGQAQKTSLKSPESKDRSESNLVLKSYTQSELVIGLIAPVGTELEKVRDILTQRLVTAGYKTTIIRMTKDVIPVLTKISPYSANDFAGYLKALMDAGNNAREQSDENGILALGAATAIRGQRPGSPKSPEHAPKHAYIISSLKHPDEVKALRKIYSDGFYLIGVHADRDRRLEYLTNEKRVAKDVAEGLIDRDTDERMKHGQRVTDTFHLSDFFVRMDGSDDRIKNSLWRIVDLLLGNPFLTPTFDEYAMFMAFAASLRSADLSRQVGAVVAKNDQVLATGANDCPRAGGGLYWPEYNEQTGMVDDYERGRDFKRGQDSNAVERKAIMDRIIKEAKKSIKGSKRFASFKEAVRTGPIKDLTEYGRVVHAEMEALLSCGRARIETHGATLYGTTFPCHNCAKHIIAAGIRRVVFIEPYQKSRAFDFHDEAIRVGFRTEGPPTLIDRVLFEPFVGVGPRRFFDLFSARLGSGYELTRKNDSTGTAIIFSLEQGILRLQMLPHSYLDMETAAAAVFQTAKVK